MLISYISRGIGSLESFLPISPKPNYAAAYEPASIQQTTLDILEQPKGDQPSMKGDIVIEPPSFATRVVSEAVSEVKTLLAIDPPAEEITQVIMTRPVSEPPSGVVDKDPRPQVFRGAISVPKTDAFGLEPNVRSRLDSLPLE